MKFKERLKSIGACEIALEWVGGRTAKQAWRECPNPHWMLWLCAKAGSLKKYWGLILLRKRCPTDRGYLRRIKQLYPNPPRLKWPK